MKPNTQTFPSICAHRGLSACCPENSLPAFASAIALSAAEIELDLWLSRDNVPVVSHDKTLDRTTNGSGEIGDLEWEEIRSFDAGSARAPEWSGIRIARFEEVVGTVDGRSIMNIHIKDPGPEGLLVQIVYDELSKNELTELAYIAGGVEVLTWARRICPGVERACLASQNESMKQVGIAIEHECRRIQFGREVSDEAIAAAKQQGMICNLFYSDDAEEARTYVNRGIDVILTNRCHVVRFDET